MKYAFFVILEDNPNEQKVIDEISNQGVEATLIPSSSKLEETFILALILPLTWIAISI